MNGGVTLRGLTEVPMINHRAPVPFTRRRLLAAAVAAACGWALWPSARALAGGFGPGAPRPVERPLAAANLYGAHDLAG